MQTRPMGAQMECWHLYSWCWYKLAKIHVTAAHCPCSVLVHGHALWRVSSASFKLFAEFPFNLNTSTRLCILICFKPRYSCQSSYIFFTIKCGSGVRQVFAQCWKWEVLWVPLWYPRVPSILVYIWVIETDYMDSMISSSCNLPCSYYPLVAQLKNPYIVK